MAQIASVIMSSHNRSQLIVRRIQSLLVKTGYQMRNLPQLKKENPDSVVKSVVEFFHGEAWLE